MEAEMARLGYGHMKFHVGAELVSTCNTSNVSSIIFILRHTPSKEELPCQDYDTDDMESTCRSPRGRNQSYHF